MPSTLRGDAQLMIRHRTDIHPECHTAVGSAVHGICGQAPCSSPPELLVAGVQQVAQQTQQRSIRPPALLLVQAHAGLQHGQQRVVLLPPSTLQRCRVLQQQAPALPQLRVQPAAGQGQARVTEALIMGHCSSFTAAGKSQSAGGWHVHIRRCWAAPAEICPAGVHQLTCAGAPR
jgi:hypothetical protein